MEARNKFVAINLKMEGKTYSEIGSSLGVSRQRAQQLCSPPAGQIVLVVMRANGKCEVCREDTAHGHFHHLSGTTTLEEFNKEPNLQYLCAGCHKKQHKKPKVVGETRVFTIRLPLRIKRLYDEQAAYERRPLGSYIRLVLEEVAKDGSVPPTSSMVTSRPQKKFKSL